VRRIVRLAPLFNNLERPQFAAALGIASGLSVFYSAMDEHPDFRELVETLLDSRRGAEAVLARILTLAAASFDDRYRNPFDIALAAYARALDKTRASYGVVAADAIQSARQAWWSSKVAKDILEKASPQVGSHTATLLAQYATAPLTVVETKSRQTQDVQARAIFVTARGHIFLGEAMTEGRTSVSSAEATVPSSELKSFTPPAQPSLLSRSAAAATVEWSS